MADCLKAAGCVVGTATAALVEAVLAGIPVVVWGIAGDLDMNPLACWESEQPMFRSRYQTAEVRQAVAFWLGLSGKERRKQMEPAQKLLGACLAPWQESLLTAIFP